MSMPRSEARCAVDLDEELRLRRLVGDPDLAEGRVLFHLRDERLADRRRAPRSSSRRWRTAAPARRRGCRASSTIRRRPAPRRPRRRRARCRRRSRPGRARGPHQPASVKIAKPELRWPQEPAFENVPTTSPDWRRGAVRSSISRSLRGDVVEADALRRAHPQEHRAAVLGRGDLALEPGEEQPGGEAEAGEHRRHDQRRVEAGVQEPMVDAREPAAEAGQRPGVLGQLALEHPRREHRAERERDERRDRHREAEGDAELAEERAGLPRQERERHEDRGERRRRRDDREEHLPGAEHRGGARPHALRPAAHDVLEHDDGVVDDEAGGEHEREQRQDVEREAHHVDQRQRADQRHRDRHRRDQRRAPVAQEQADDARRRSATESSSVRSTSWMAPSMKTASSPVTKMRTPSGSSPASSATTARTPLGDARACCSAPGG